MSMDYDIEELAGYAMGLSEDEVEEMINDGTVDNLLYEEYEVNLDTYQKIVEDLLPFTQRVQAGITGEWYHAFVDEGPPSRMICKIKCKKKGSE